MLVHGAWQAPFVWDSVKTNLEAAGDKIVVVELPAHGNDTTSPTTVTMNLYRDKVVKTIDNIAGKVILAIAYSLGFGRFIDKI